LSDSGKELGQDEQAILAWCATWIQDGFNAYRSFIGEPSVIRGIFVMVTLLD
jgi:hypothetical protein